MNYGDKLATAVKQKQEEEARTQIIEDHALNQMQDNSVINKIFSNDRMSGISTGYPSLDAIIGGLKAGECIVVGGDTGMGKSTFGANILVNISKKNIPTCYLDLENGDAVTYMRLMAFWFDKTLDWFNKPDNREKALEMKAEIDLNMVYYSREHLDKIGFNDDGISTIEAVIVGEVRHGVKVFMIDPLQTIEQNDNPSNNFSLQGEFAEKMKNLAQKYEITIIILHHLRKTSYAGGRTMEAEDFTKPTKTFYRKPILEDFKGSSKITDFATSVWGVVRPLGHAEAKMRSVFWVGILKNRSGKMGELNLRFNEDTLRITEKPAIPQFITDVFSRFTDPVDS